MKGVFGFIAVVGIALVGIGIYQHQARQEPELVDSCHELVREALRFPVEAQFEQVEVGPHSDFEALRMVKGHVVAPNAMGVRSRLTYRCEVEPSEYYPTVWGFWMDGDRLASTYAQFQEDTASD